MGRRKSGTLEDRNLWDLAPTPAVLAAAGAPANVDYLVKTASDDLSAERVVTDTASVTWDWATGGQAKANVVTGTASGIAPSDAEYIVGALTSGLSAERLVTNSSSLIWDLSTAGVVKANVVGFGTPTTPVDWKESVVVATTGNIALTGEQTLDGVLTSASRVLVKSNSTGSQNGIYVSAAGAWSRATDADVDPDLSSGAAVFVEQGTVNGQQVFMLTTAGTITIGTTAQTWVSIVLPFSFFVMSTVGATTRTSQLTDSGKMLDFTAAGATTYTVAPQATIAHALNTEIMLYRSGAADLTVAAGVGVTIRSLTSNLTLRQYDVAKLKKVANPNTWALFWMSDVSSTRTLTAGAGLTGGGTLAADRTFDVGAGTGITVNANDVAVAFATTTETLTGTETAKSVSPDDLAALWEKGADTASSGTTALGEGGYFHVTGTTTITDIDWSTAKDGRTAWVIFDGILTLTHNASTLKLPGGANITTAAGDRAIFVQDASDNVICLDYVRADGTPIAGGSGSTGKQTIYIPTSAMQPAITNGPQPGFVETVTNKCNHYVLDFDATTAEQAWFQIAMPKGWDESTVTFQAWWTSTATDTDGVAISLAGFALSDNETLDTAVGTPVVVTDDFQSNASRVMISAESTAVTIAGSPAEGDMCFFRVQRVVSDANDDMSEDMRLIGIKLFYTTNAGTDA